MGNSSSKKSLDDWEISFNRAFIEATEDLRFFFIKDEYLEKLKEIYKPNFNDLEKFGVSAYKFLDYAREAFERYKNMKKEMPLEPLNKKSWAYVETSLKNLIEALQKKFG